MKHDLTQGNIVKVLTLFTIPLILSGLFQQMFNWADAFIVGNIEGELALGGIGAVTSLYNLFVTVIVGFASGISILAAQQHGMGKTKQLKGILSTFVLLLGGVFGVIAIFGAPLTKDILTLLDTPASIFDIGKEYLQILFIGIPFLAVYNTYSAVLRGIGDSKAAFLSVLVCSVFNIVLDLVFVAALQYGVAGAAAATVISQAAMTIFVVSYTIRKYPVLRFHFGKGIVCRSFILAGAKFSLPPAIQSGAGSVGNLILQRFMNGFGEQTVAAITTAYRVDSAVLLPVINFGSGIATVVAQNIGAGNQIRARKVLKTGSIMMAIVSLCLTGLVILAGKYLIAIFGLSAESVEIGKSFFYTIAACYVIYGLAMALRGYLEGTGDMLFSGIAGITSLCARIIASYAFASRFGNMVIGYAEAFSWIVLLAIYFVRFLLAGQTNKRCHASQSSLL
ncbi:MAG: MATE family efflux transporter [Lachnospiraceae bacterium]|nr:MATE family efflux transporter [Lachnospiraceae bacterium]